MAQMGRRGLSAARKTELWERWKRGQSLNDIATRPPTAMRERAAGAWLWLDAMRPGDAVSRPAKPALASIRVTAAGVGYRRAP
jgi:hypothetical protein